MAHYSDLSLTPLFDLNGRALAGAYIRFYDAGGNTPRAAYSDGALTALYDPNNIRANAYGRLPKVWLQSTGSYRAVITSATGAAVETIEDIEIEVPSSGGGGGSGGTTIPTGFIAPYYGTTTPNTDWIRANGRTIGSATSLASERADPDCEALFLHLWNTDASLAVSGGRGVSAAADWAANKTIALPSGRGRALFGRDSMGNGAAGLFAGVTFASGAADTLGSYGGAALHTLIVAETPAHAHTGTTGSSGSHAHTGTTNADGLHAHTGSTLSDGAHVHGYLFSNALSIGGTTGGSTFAPPNAATTTDSSGAHTHVLSINQGGSHTHSFGTNTTGDHTHSFTTNLTGGDGAHNNMPPFLLVTWLIKK